MDSRTTLFRAVGRTKYRLSDCQLAETIESSDICFNIHPIGVSGIELKNKLSVNELC
jgi:citrate lyase gamma subunit